MDPILSQHVPVDGGSSVTGCEHLHSNSLRLVGTAIMQEPHWQVREAIMCLLENSIPGSPPSTPVRPALDLERTIVSLQGRVGPSLVHGPLSS